MEEGQLFKWLEDEQQKRGEAKIQNIPSLVKREQPQNHISGIVSLYN